MQVYAVELAMMTGMRVGELAGYTGQISTMKMVY